MGKNITTNTSTDFNKDSENITGQKKAEPFDTAYTQNLDTKYFKNNRYGKIKFFFFNRLAEVNKELWLLLSMFLIAYLINYVVSANYMLLGFYSLPSIFSAYFFGRRHATLTAFASVLLVGFLTYFNSGLFIKTAEYSFFYSRWNDIAVWAGVLMITAYAMGTLYDRDKERVLELQRAYRGVLHILRQFVAKDKYTENHSYRVSIYAAKIASYMGFNPTRVADVRDAALLHDIGKLEVSRELLYKASRLTYEEFDKVKKHAENSTRIIGQTEGPLARIIPIILAHHDKFDGSGYRPNKGDDIPLEARIISVADVYDALASDRPYRKAMSSFEAKKIIEKGSGTDFDPDVVAAFIVAFNKGEMEIPEVIL